MHRLIAAASAAVLSLTLLAPPAQAADIVIVSRSGNQVGDPSLLVTSTICGDPLQVTSDGYTYDRVNGPGTAPRGDGSLQITRQDTGLITGLAFISGRDLNDLASSFAGSFRTTFDGQAVAAVARFVDPFWRGIVVVPTTANTWTSVDFTTLDFDWSDGNGGSMTGTIAEFITAHGAGSVVGILGGSQCETPTAGSVYLDNVRIGAGSDTQIFDFEPLIPTALTAVASKSVITNGDPVTLRTTMTGAGSPVAGGVVRLFHKPFGAASYTMLGQATTNANGVASLVAHPKKITSYQWRYDGDTQTYAAGQSPIRAVGVRAKVTLSVADPTLVPGQKLIVTGLVSPAKTGFVATLWRKTATGKVKLASTTMVRADGTYRISKVLTNRGTYKVFVTVPAAKGNLAGTSPIRTATVS
jgi:hypothetical protein